VGIGVSGERMVMVLNRGEKRDAIMENTEFCGEYSRELVFAFGGDF